MSNFYSDDNVDMQLVMIILFELMDKYPKSVSVFCQYLELSSNYPDKIGITYLDALNYLYNNRYIDYYIYDPDEVGEYIPDQMRDSLLKIQKDHYRSHGEIEGFTTGGYIKITPLGVKYRNYLAHKGPTDHKVKPETTSDRQKRTPFLQKEVDEEIIDSGDKVSELIDMYDKLEKKMMEYVSKVENRVEENEKVTLDHQNKINSFYARTVEIFGIFVALFSFIIVSLDSVIPNLPGTWEEALLFIFEFGAIISMVFVILFVLIFIFVFKTRSDIE